MGITSINDVLSYVKSDTLEKQLVKCRDEHEKLSTEMQQLLDEYGDEGKNPNPIVKGMGWIKTNVKLVLNDSDHVVADLITDGCNMGVKSLSKYLNQYKAASEVSKDITKRLINLEHSLATEMRQYL